MSDRSCPCSRALHSWIFAWVVAEMTGDRLAGAKSWRQGVEHSQVKGLLSPCPELNEDGVGGEEGRRGVSSWPGWGAEERAALQSGLEQGGKHALPLGTIQPGEQPVQTQRETYPR